MVVAQPVNYQLSASQTEATFGATVISRWCIDTHL